MLELPEVRTIARDLRKEIQGKTITSVGGTFTGHKSTFYHDDPETYNGRLTNKRITDIIDRNFYVEIEIEDYLLLFRDGANIRYYDKKQTPSEKSKLFVTFDDGSCLNVTVLMYAFIGLYEKNAEIDNEYYLMEINRIGALDAAFSFEHFTSLIDEKTQKLSIKMFLAAEQRIPGIGNGVIQDILFNAGLRPKRKMHTLSEVGIRSLYTATINTLTAMVNQDGRDTERSIYGTEGNYKTILSNKSYKNGCPKCGSEIIKEEYKGSSIYYCPSCQI